MQFKVETARIANRFTLQTFQFRSEVGIYKRKKKKVKREENTLSTKKVTKKKKEKTITNKKIEGRKWKMQIRIKH